MVVGATGQCIVNALAIASGWPEARKNIDPDEVKLIASSL